MRKSLQHDTMQNRIEHLFSLISGQRFLEKQGLGNEIPFFICPYNPKENYEMDRSRRQLVKRLEQKGVRIREINLYDLSIDLLRKRGIWEQVLQRETELAKEQLQELLQGVLDPETHLIPAIAALIADHDYDVLFLSGVGEVYPYIRTHNVLNNLQSTSGDKPMVIFFPGDYTQSQEMCASLDLFGRLHNDKYYRAFDIYHCEP